MYRLMLPLLLCAGALLGAPQDSDVTFVKIQPLAADERPGAARADPGLGALASDELVRRARQDDSSAALDDEDTEAPELPQAARGSERGAARETERIPSARTTTARSFGRPLRQTQPSPRFISKLSYFDEVRASSGVADNLVEKFGKDARRFQTTCRCEKIWNCPKLQITVPRCPTDYYLCCD